MLDTARFQRVLNSFFIQRSHKTLIRGGVLGITLVSTPLRLWRALRNIGKHVF